MPKLKPLHFDIFFVLILLGMSYSFQYFNMIDTPPNGVHNWRQSDAASIAYMYYSEGNSLFEPKMHNLLEVDGKAVSEFPGLYYIVSLGYRAFGFHHWVFRGFWMLILLTGIFCLYKFSDRILKDKFWSMFIAAITFTSPVFIVYGISFMPDPIALSFIFISWYFIYKYIEKAQFSYLFMSVVFTCLAGLLKITVLIPNIAIGIVAASIWIIKRIRREISTLDLAKKLFSFLIIGIVVASWYIYARWYNEQNYTSIFLLNARPYWELTKEQISAATNGLYGWIKKDSFHPDGLNALIVLAVLALLPVFQNRIKRSYFLVFVFSLVGIFSYMMLFYRQFDAHDYYIISILFIVPLILIVFLKKYKWIFYKNKISKLFLQLAAAFLFIICFKYAIDRSKHRFAIQDGWLDLDLYELRYKLDEYGISKSDLILVPHDPSTNITLYAIDMRGWTAINNIRLSGVIEDKIKAGAKYMLVSDPRFYDNPIIDPYKDNLIVDYKGIRIYELK